MKIESFMILILAFGFVLIAVNGIIGDFSQNYDINSTLINSSKYNYYSELNNSVSTIQSDIGKVGETTGWKQILVGASALWNGVISSAKMVLLAPVYIAQMISGTSTDLGVPSEVLNMLIPILIVMMTIVIIFVIVRFVRGDASV